MPTPASERCVHCLFWHHIPFTDASEKLGECRAHPPAIVEAIVATRLSVITDSSIAVEDATRFPLTKSHQGCGEFMDPSSLVPL